MDYKYVIKSLREQYDENEIGLIYNNIFELLIATVLSAQTTDQKVNKVGKTLFKKYPDLENLANARLEDVIEIIKELGLFNIKAKNIINISKMILSDFEGIIPDNMNDLIKLPGVGRKTANVVLANGFDKYGIGIVVDTHVIRLSNRFNWVNGDNASIVETKLMSMIDKKYWRPITNLLILHGRNICKAKKPQCKNCILNLKCPSVN